MPELAFMQPGQMIFIYYTNDDGPKIDLLPIRGKNEVPVEYALDDMKKPNKCNILSYIIEKVAI